MKSKETQFAERGSAMSSSQGDLLASASSLPAESSKRSTKSLGAEPSADHLASPINGSPSNGNSEFIDSIELARRWSVPVSWVRDQVRSRAPDPLPHVNFGKYVRFLWRSPDLEDWVARRIVKGNNRRVGRV